MSKTWMLRAVLVPTCAWGQQPTLNARELFYTPAADAAPAKPADKGDKKPAPSKPAPKQASKETTKQPTAPAKADTHSVTASVPLGLRYAVLKRDANGKYQEVDPDTSFRSGDRIRIKVDSNTSGFLYVVTQGSSGNWELLFPSAQVAGGDNHVDKGDSRQVPPGDRGQFVFDEHAGTEKLFIVLTRQPEPDLDKLIYSMGGAGSKATDSGSSRALMAQASLRDDVISKMRGEVLARDLVFEKVDDSNSTDGKLENAAYVVNPSTKPDARLVVDVSLKHR